MTKATTRSVIALGIAGAASILHLFEAFSNVTAPIGFGAAGAAVAIRFRRRRGIEREQLKWFLAVAAVCAIAFPFGSLLPPGPIADASFLVAIGGLVSMPIAIGIAILRYRLYEIDRLVSRTIAYTIMTAGLIVVYLVVNLGLTTVFESLTGGNSERTAAAFAARLRHEVDMEAVTTDLARTAGSAVVPASLDIWLRTGAAGR